MNYASQSLCEDRQGNGRPARTGSEPAVCKAAAKLQAVHNSWRDKPSGLNDALMYNRRLWTVFIDAVIRDDNKLPMPVRQNLANLGVFVMGETFSLMTNPKPDTWCR